MIMELFVVGGLVTVTVFLLDYLLKPKLDFPMPSFRLPLLGHALFLGKKPQQKLESWGRKCGPVYMIQVFNKAVVVVNDNLIFGKMCESGDFEARNKSFRFNMIACAEHDGIPKDLFSQDATPQHAMLKKFTLDTVDRMRKSAFFTDLVNHIQTSLVVEISRNTVNNVVDPYDIVTNEIYNYYFCAAKGILSPLENGTLRKIVKTAHLIRYAMSDKGKSLEIFPWLKYFGNQAYTNLTEVNSLMDEIFQDFKQNIEANGPNIGLASGYLTDANRPNVPDDVKTSLLVGNCIGAAEPAVTTFYAIFLVLAGHTEVQEKIRKEIASRNLKKPFVPSKECQSPYIEAVLMETLRYTSPLPLFIRRALTDTMIEGHLIPKDTSVLVNLYAGHHEEAVWTDPWVFRPERFLGSDGNLLPTSHKFQQNFKAFGEAQKKCLGIPVVKDLLFALIASLVDSFAINGVAGMDVPHDSRSWEGMALGAFPARCPLKFQYRY